MTTTIIYAPHPDDETLYTAGYVDYCRRRGDKLILVAVTDGGASGAKPADWTTADLMRVRAQEQTRAWDKLTGGKGMIIRMGLPDGGVSKASVTAMAESLEKIYVKDVVEHYVCGYGTSVHPDHVATALGVKGALVRVPRGTYPPSEITYTGATVYTPSDTTAVSAAWDSYAAFGHTSVKSEFDKLKTNAYTTKVRLI
jgi:LmbE family N-acetylglucosaminyl deacetylase